MIHFSRGIKAHQSPSQSVTLQLIFFDWLDCLDTYKSEILFSSEIEHYVLLKPQILNNFNSITAERDMTKITSDSNVINTKSLMWLCAWKNTRQQKITFWEKNAFCIKYFYYGIPILVMFLGKCVRFIPIPWGLLTKNKCEYCDDMTKQFFTLQGVL